MLLDSDLPALKVDFLELQNSKWRASNCVGKQTSRAFQQYKQSILWPRIDDVNWRSTPAFCPNLASSARKGSKTRVERPNWHKYWRSTPRRTSTRATLKAQPKHTPSGPRKQIYASITYFCKPQQLVYYKQDFLLLYLTSFEFGIVSLNIIGCLVLRSEGLAIRPCLDLSLMYFQTVEFLHSID